MEKIESLPDSGKSGLQEGYSRCEFCNYVGKSESFFSKSKRFCSCVCSRSYSSSKRDKSHHTHNSKTHEKKIHLLDKNLKKNALLNGSIVHKTTKAKSFEWTSYMESENASAAPVSCFSHCSFNEFWQGSLVGTVVEVVNNEAPTTSLSQPVFWFATIVAVQGYYVKLRYVGFESSSKDFYKHLCCDEVHPVGWCASNAKDLVAPASIQSNSCNSKKYLVDMLTGAWTYPEDLCSKATDSSAWCLVSGTRVEVVDKMCISSMKAAVVEECKGGRLKLKYLPSQGDQDEHFWCHSLSYLVHPVGWSSVIGHHIDASPEYKAASLSRAAFKQYLSQDATPNMFAKMAQRCNLPIRNQLPKRSSRIDTSSSFQAGMKLEAVDPLNLNNICVATVARVLKGDYIMVSFDNVDGVPTIATTTTDNHTYHEQLGSFCMHSSSSYLLPAGFCEINKLTLTPPKGYKQPFDWVTYFQETKSIPAPLHLFNQDVPNHSFRAGMKVEAVDLMEPRMICVATINQIVGRLMRIGFDGWGTEYDQWIDCQSVDIYPPGWCQLFSFKLEAPKQYSTPDPLKNKKNARGHIFKGGRKRRRMKALTSEHHLHPLSMSVCADDDDDEDDDDDASYVYKKTSLLASRDKDFFSESSPIYSPYESDLDSRGNERSFRSERQNIFCQLSSRVFDNDNSRFTQLLIKSSSEHPNDESLAT